MREKESILFHNNPSPMWMYETKTGRIVDVNRAAIGQYGYSREEFLQLTISQLRSQEEIPCFYPRRCEGINLPPTWKYLSTKRKMGNLFFRASGRAC